jgi:hypothetical protein
VATDPSDAMRACAGYRGGQPRSGGLGFERAGCPSNIIPTSQRTTRWRSNAPRKTSLIFRLPTLERRPCADTSSYALHVCVWKDFFGPCTTSIRRRRIRITYTYCTTWSTLWLIQRITAGPRVQLFAWVPL